MKTRVGVIFGGRSSEHEISIRSARTVFEQIDKDKYDVIPIAITDAGHWLNPSDSLRILPNETSSGLVDSAQAMTADAIALVGDTKYKGLTAIGGNNGERF